MASNGSTWAWRPAAAEGIATFLFVFLGVGTVIVISASGLAPTGAGLLPIAFAHGLAIALLVAATAHLSGGHINPAVTFGAVITGKLSVQQGSLYVVAQLGGAVLAALLLAAVMPDVELGKGGGVPPHALAPGLSVGAGLVIEIVLTAVLVFVVVSAAMDPRGAGNLAPLAIGLAVLVDNLVGVSLTGASMNPARTFGPALAANSWGDHWVYWIGPLAGGALAALTYKYVFEKSGNGG